MDNIDRTMQARLESYDRTMQAKGKELFEKQFEARLNKARQMERSEESPLDIVDIVSRGKGAPSRDAKGIPGQSKAPDTAREISPHKERAEVKEGAQKEKRPVKEPAQEKDWTVLCYIDGNNDLEQFATYGLLDLEAVGSSDNVNVVAQLGRISQEKLKKICEEAGKPYEPTNVDGDWAGVRRYYVTGDDPSNPDQIMQINSPLIKDLKNKDMSNPSTLADFLIWGMKNYPAKHYLVVLMDHGGGWRGAFTDDASSEGGHIMKPQGITEALKLAETATGKKPDVVDMVACLMASGEMAYEMRDASKYLVASEEMGTTAAFAYSPIIETMNQLAVLGIDYTPKDLAKFLVDYYKDKPEAFVTKSAMDLEKMNGVKDAVDDLAKALIKTKTPKEVIKEAIQDSQGFSKVFQYEFYTHFRDLYDVAAHLAKNRKIKDPALKEAAKAVMKAVDDAVIANIGGAYARTEVLDQTKSRDGKEDVTLIKVSQGKFDSHGLSVYAPTDKKYTSDKVMKEYKELALSEDTKWDEFLLHHTKPETKKGTKKA
jgi:hypothetical protein